MVSVELEDAEEDYAQANGNRLPYDGRAVPSITQSGAEGGLTMLLVVLACVGKGSDLPWR